MALAPTQRNRMMDKLLAIEGWSYRLRRILADAPEAACPALVTKACGEIQYRFEELRTLSKVEEEK